jgi:hypothetical protein
MFYVYAHRRKDTNRVFYVGKGTGKRAWKHAGRNDWWHRIVKKHGRTVEIVFRFDDENLAFLMERELIDFYGRDNLCNMTDGGMGGISPTLETREKISAANKGKLVSEATREKMRIASTGKTHSEETKQKLRAVALKQKRKAVSDETKRKISASKKVVPASEAMKQKLSQARKGVPTGRTMSEENKLKLIEINKSRVFTEEAKRKISEKAKGRKFTEEALKKVTENNRINNEKRRKPIACSNGMIFSFSGDAESWLRGNGFPKASRSNIVACCGGSVATAYGFHWKYHKI